MNIAIFSTATDPQTGAWLMENAARKAGHDVRVSDFTTPEEKAWFTASDICIIRVGRPTYQKAIAGARYYKEQNPDGLLATSAWGVEHSFDKYLSYEVMKTKDIKTPKTYRITEAADIDRLSLKDKLPLIMKPLNYNGGKGITVARTADELEAQLHTLLDVFEGGIVQHFYAEAEGTDVRAFVIGDTVVAAMKRTAPKGSDVANLTQGGSAVAIELSEEMQQLAVRATHAFDTLFAGVDLLITNDGATVLEVNISPGFALADITHVDLSRLIIDYLTQKKRIS